MECQGSPPGCQKVPLSATAVDQSLSLGQKVSLADLEEEKVTLEAQKVPLEGQKVQLDQKVSVQRQKVPLEDQKVPLEGEKVQLDQKVSVQRQKVPLEGLKVPQEGLKVPLDLKVSVQRQKVPLEGQKVPLECQKVPLDQKVSPPDHLPPKEHKKSQSSQKVAMKTLRKGLKCPSWKRPITAILRKLSANHRQASGVTSAPPANQREEQHDEQVTKFESTALDDKVSFYTPGALGKFENDDVAVEKSQNTSPVSGKFEILPESPRKVVPKFDFDPRSPKKYPVKFESPRVVRKLESLCQSPKRKYRIDPCVRKFEITTFSDFSPTMGERKFAFGKKKCETTTLEERSVDIGKEKESLTTLEVGKFESEEKKCECTTLANFSQTEAEENLEITTISELSTTLCEANFEAQPTRGEITTLANFPTDQRTIVLLDEQEKFDKGDIAIFCYFPAAVREGKFDCGEKPKVCDENVNKADAILTETQENQEFVNKKQKCIKKSLEILENTRKYNEKIEKDEIIQEKQEIGQEKGDTLEVNKEEITENGLFGAQTMEKDAKLNKNQVIDQKINKREENSKEKKENKKGEGLKEGEDQEKQEIQEKSTINKREITENGVFAAQTLENHGMDQKMNEKEENPEEKEEEKVKDQEKQKKSTKNKKELRENGLFVSQTIGNDTTARVLQGNNDKTENFEEKKEENEEKEERKESKEGKEQEKPEKHEKSTKHKKGIRENGIFLAQTLKNEHKPKNFKDNDKKIGKRHDKEEKRDRKTLFGLFSKGESLGKPKMAAGHVRNKRLLKEYKNLSRSPNLFFSVELVNECLDEWKIRLHRVDQDSLLHRDMLELNIPYILLSLSFPESFPFAPPFLRVLSPRLEKGFVMEGGAVCMELLTPRGWASAYTIEAIIMQFAASLVKGQGRVSRKAKGSAGKEFTKKSAELAFRSLVRTHERYGWVTPPLSEG